MADLSFRLNGRVALVTGSGRGIGRAIAMTFAARGAAVAVQDIELAVASELVAAIELAGGKAIAVGGDVTDPDVAGRMHQEVCDRLGPPVVLVNNAAVQMSVPWTEATVEQMAWQWRGNVVMPWLLTRLCAPAMKDAKWGRVINVSSIQGKRLYISMLGYGVTKAALDGMTQAMARELGPSGITVNAIAPGYFDTFRNRASFPSEASKIEQGRGVPVGRVGDPEDVCGAALMLCSDAGSYITGQVLYVDGGLLLR